MEVLDLLGPTVSQGCERNTARCQAIKHQFIPQFAKDGSCEVSVKAWKHPIRAWLLPGIKERGWGLVEAPFLCVN